MTLTRIFVATAAVLVGTALACQPALAQPPAESPAAHDALVKNEVETAVSMLGAVFAYGQRHGMSLADSKALGADLLRDLRYGKDGYFWADTTAGVNVVLYGRTDVEGRNRLEDRDADGMYYVKAFLAKAKAGGGYIDYLFPKLGEKEALPKRSYVLAFEPFGWVIGSGYYR